MPGGGGCRLLTPPGRSALAVLEFAGRPGRRRLAELGIVRLPRPGAHLVVRVPAPGGAVEPAVLGARPGAGDVFELHVHGNPARVAALLGGPPPAAASAERAARWWSTPAHSLGPDAVEVLAAALAAPGLEGLKHALAQLAPGGVLEILSGERGAERSSEARAALAAGHRIRPLFDPPLVAFVGPANAGKSSIVNLLAGRERQRTGPRAALTRDPVLVAVEVGGWPLRLLDTAGALERPGGLDAAAFERGLETAGRADLAVLVVPEGAGSSMQPGTARVRSFLEERGVRVLPLQTFAREGGARGTLAADLAREDPTSLRARIGTGILAALGLPPGPPRPAAAWILPSQRERLAALAGEGLPGEDAGKDRGGTRGGGI